MTLRGCRHLRRRRISASASRRTSTSAARRARRIRTKTPQIQSAATVTCAIVVGVGFGLLLVPSLLPLRGLLQRVAEVGVFGWIALTSVALLRNKLTPH